MTHFNLTMIGALLLGSASVAVAGGDPASYTVGRHGVIGGSTKDYRNVVPVPAPNPSNSPQKDWYVRGDLGYTFAANNEAGQSDETSRLFGGVGFGRYITPSLRADITAFFKHTDNHDFVGLFNIYYDFDRHAGFKPYIGLGIGGASFDADEVSGSRFGFAASATGGITIDLAPSIKLDSGYQFLWSDSRATEGQDDHIIRTGLRLDISP